MNAIATLSTYAKMPAVLDRYLAITPNPRVAQVYISECLLAVANNTRLQECTPQSIITASLRAATMGLHLDLDEAYLIPYKDQCTLITGYKGLRSMAMRTNAYSMIHATTIPASYTVTFDPLNGTPTHERNADSQGGCIAYFRMDGRHNYFEKTIYMSHAEIEDHAKQYSKSYSDARSPWNASPRSRERMKIKTVFRRLMLEWGYLSPIDQRMIVTEEDQTVDPELPELPELNQTEQPKKSRAQLIAELTQ